MNFKKYWWVWLLVAYTAYVAVAYNIEGGAGGLANFWRAWFHTFGSKRTTDFPNLPNGMIN
jgi:hypothetical protein